MCPAILNTSDSLNESFFFMYVVNNRLLVDAQCIIIASKQIWQDLGLFLVNSHMDYIAIELCPEFNNYWSDWYLLAD